MAKGGGGFFKEKKEKKKIVQSEILPLLINPFASPLNRIDGIIKLSEGRADIVN